MEKPIFVAEVKTQSPFGFKSDRSWEELFEVANQHGDWLSIHTDQRWGGNFELVRKARNLTEKPILAKGIHNTDEEISEAVQSGADYVLVVGRLPNLEQERCLVEVNNLDQLAGIPQDLRVVWNQRDLRNGQPKSETFEQARIQWPGWLAQASNIENVNQVNARADAFIVGENLLRFVADFQEL